MLQSMGWQRIGHNWATELNWKNRNWVKGKQMYYLGLMRLRVAIETGGQPGWWLWILQRETRVHRDMKATVTKSETNHKWSLFLFCRPVPFPLCSKNVLSWWQLSTNHAHKWDHLWQASKVEWDNSFSLLLIYKHLYHNSIFHFCLLDCKA